MERSVDWSGRGNPAASVGGVVIVCQAVQTSA